MQLRATRVSRESLRRLPMPARQIVDPADVEVPEGYEVEAVPVGLSVPTGIGFTKDRGQDVGEGRSV